MKKQFMAAGIAATMGIAGLGAGVASATTAKDSNNPMSSLVDAISTKFNLNQTEVQAVFDAQRSEMETQREANVTKKLSQLVTDAKLTQVQADAITSKRAELKKAHEAARATNGDMMDEERRATREAERTALKQWASDNKISEDYLKYVMGGHRGGLGGGEGRGHGMPENVTDTTE